MMRKKKLLIVNFQQFGYHTDTLVYPRYLKDEYEITYFCWDYGYKKVVEDGARVVYLPRTGGEFQRIIRFYSSLRKEMKAGNYDVVFVLCFRGCSLVPFLGPYRTIVLNIITGYVRPGLLKKLAYNGLIRLETITYRHIAMLTEELRAKLGVPVRKSHILPLGAETTDLPPKSFTAMRLLYVGTFVARDIYKSVEGFELFASQYRTRVELSYDLVGYGSPADEEKMRATIEACSSRDLIRWHGRIPQSELRPYRERSNIGVVFVPITDYQAPQPYTKLYEYLAAGMPVLATANDSNKKIVTPANGVLVEDSPRGVCEGLTTIFERLSTYDSESIKRESRKYSFEGIVNDSLRPYLADLLRRKG